ncbi:MAG: lipopolysaccharide transport periplasmic protein LptA [Campylobacterales bacterium]|nr:lipopolysaccharide transport periplasmic protein LptA [Campylobacterales bacterium]
MRYLLLLLLSLHTMYAQELKITSDSFHADENEGISVFTGHVNIIKRSDELNASEVTVYTDKNNKPTKFVAIGDVTFVIETKQGAKYSGIAQKAVFLPQKKEYHFFKDVHLKQLDEKKEIQGDEVVLEIVNGKAYAKGVVKKPVIMIFDIVDEETN